MLNIPGYFVTFKKKDGVLWELHLEGFLFHAN